MDLGMQFDSFGSIYDPVPGLLISLGIDIELGQKGRPMADYVSGSYLLHYFR